MNTRLTPEQVVAVRKDRVAGVPAATLAKQYNVAPHTIRDCVTGRTYKKCGGPLLLAKKGPTIVRRLTDAEILDLRERAEAGEKTPDLAARYRITRSYARQIVIGKHYPDGPGPIQPKQRSTKWAHPPELILAIRKDGASGMGSAALAAKYGIPRNSICRYQYGHSRASVGGPIKGIDYE